MSSHLEERVENSQEEQKTDLRIYNPGKGWFNNRWGLLDFKDWGILTLYILLSAIAIPVAMQVDCNKKINPTPQKSERTIQDYAISGKTEIPFNSLEQIGEHEYIVRINGKSFAYQFDLDKSKVRIYSIRRK